MNLTPNLLPREGRGFPPLSVPGRGGAPEVQIALSG